MRADYLGSEDISAMKKNFHGNYHSHWHEFYEIEYIISGSGIYVIDGKEYTIKPGMLFFMTPVNFHSVKGENVRLYNLHFSSVAANPEYLIDIAGKNFSTTFELSSESSEFIEMQLEEMTKNENDKRYQSVLLNCVLAKLIRTKNEIKSNILSPVAMAELYILNNFRDNISLSEVANYTGFSDCYFSLVFKKETGKSFKEYTDNLKFEYAMKLLKYTDYTVLQICNESGFEDYANFLRRFKNREKVSPTEYRKNLK